MIIGNSAAAVGAVDLCLARLLPAVRKAGGVALITGWLLMAWAGWRAGSP